VGGGARTAELTLPGFRHDVCSAIHPMAAASPFFRSLPLDEHGLEWIHPDAPLAHPLDDGPPAMLERSVEATGTTLGADAHRYERWIAPFVRHWPALAADALGPLSLPHHPILLARFGLRAVRSASGLARAAFRGARARALFAGLAAHSILPLEQAPSAAIGLMLQLAAHAGGWPLPRGGSQSLSDALASLLRSLGGEIRTGARVDSLDEVETSGPVLFDVAPRELLRIARDRLPAGYCRRLERFRHGPAAFKLDWALDGPIPWRDEACARAGTVHVGGAIEEIEASERACWRGRHSDRPFVLVAQQSLFDPSRAPDGKHTGWAYCHVPSGSCEDRSEAIEAQVERFAPGFRDRILARHRMTSADYEQYNANFVGGDISGGVADLRQLFFRPAPRPVPYRTPHPRIFLCSASTPPGGGVHGMGGYHAARAALGESTWRLLTRK
jgi:phytoene dehydrogenase-like protein